MKQAVVFFDRELTRVVEILPHWIHPIMGAFTFIAYPAVIIPLLLIGIIYFYMQKNISVSAACFAVLCSMGVNSLLKIFLHRPRPETLYVEAMVFKTHSFPSGHAFGAMVFYGLLTYLFYQIVPQPWSIFVLFFGIIIIFGVGLSRVYLGAHFPTDVIGGWLFGAAVLYLIINFLKPAL